MFTNVQVKLWQQTDGNWTAVDTIKMEESATAVDVLDEGDMRLVAVGTEGGSVSIYTVTSEVRAELSTVIDPRYDWMTGDGRKADSSHAHVSTVNRLAWRPVREGRPLQLASCADDRSVRIYTIEA